MDFEIDSGALGFMALLLLILVWIALFLTWAWAPRVEGSSTVGQELERLPQLKADGHLSEEEFQTPKAKLLKA